jgi:hypothetical protein
MKKLIIIFALCCFISCQEKKKHVVQMKTKDEKGFNSLKDKIGLSKSYSDTLSLISYDFDDEENDKKYLKVDYEKKIDSLYNLMDEELNIIGFEDHFTADARTGLDKLKQSYIQDLEAANWMWGASYGPNYRAYRIDENAFKRIEQMIYKRRYEELLIYNYHLRSNFTRWWEDPHTFRYKKRLEDLVPKKFLDSMYPKKKKMKP